MKVRASLAKYSSFTTNDYTETLQNVNGVTLQDALFSVFVYNVSFEVLQPSSIS